MLIILSQRWSGAANGRRSAGEFRARTLDCEFSEAAGPVSRILSAGLLPQDGHSSGPRITARLGADLPGGCDAPSRHDPSELGIPPYLVLLRVGFALPAALLPRRCALTAPFTLTPTLPPRRYVLCGTSRQPGLNPASRTLSGTLLCGVRTFLPRRPKAPRATIRSSCLPDHYMRYMRCRRREPDRRIFLWV